MYKILIPILLLFAACTTKQSSKPQSKENTTIQAKKKPTSAIKINLNVEKTKDKLRLNQKLKINYKSSLAQNPDSILIKTESGKTVSIVKPESPVEWQASEAKTGVNNISFTFYYGDSIKQRKQLKLRLYADNKAKLYSYKVIKKWPHNTRAYTQGLEFNEGILYEGTGQYGESSLSKIDLDKNEVLQTLNLDQQVFGEGISIFGDKVYQLTWRSSIGFVYDKSNLKKLYDFSYPTEGWGLCNDGKELIMSDGSENIYYLDIEFLQETKRLQVYDYNGPVTQLNELEYINGRIYANVYGTHTIVVIDAQTGAVLEKINLNNLLDRKKYTKPVDVLNGIAWDDNSKRLIVTGKWWPYYYQIEPIAVN